MESPLSLRVSLCLEEEHDRGPEQELSDFEPHGSPGSVLLELHLILTPKQSKTPNKNELRKLSL